MDEIVFVPLMIDESEPPSRLRSYRRKPKHPQKLSMTQSNLQQQSQQQQQQHVPSQHQQQRRDYLGQCSSSDSSGEQSSGESQNENLFYFGEQTHKSKEQTHNSFSSSDGRCESGDENLSSSGELSYSDLTSDFASSPSIVNEGSGLSSTAPSTRELFVPAPNGDGYYILTTTSPTPMRNDPVQPKMVDDDDDVDDAGFSIYDNLPLDDADDDDDDNDGILTANQIIRKTARSSYYRPTKLKILTMEMRPELEAIGSGVAVDKTAKSRPELVETTVEIKQEATSQALDPSFDEDALSHRNRLDGWIHCGQCERVFDTENRMRRHMKLVHGPKSYFCPECNKSFTQYGHMQVHLRTVHTADKPFECYVCHRRFNVSSNRNRHQRLHFTKGSLHFVPNGATIVQAGGQNRVDEAGGKMVEKMEA